MGLVLQGGAALGAYEVGAIEYLYESGMECAIAAGASSGAVNAVTLAGAKEYPPKVLRRLWEELMVEPPIPFLPPLVSRSWSMFGVPHMYSPRWDYWNLPTWTSFCDTTLLKETLEDLLDWEQVRDPKHMRVFVSASGVETGETRYFSNTDPKHPFGSEHVLASGSFPPGFPWTMVDHRAYWDGGLTDNTPLKPVIDHLEGDEPEFYAHLHDRCLLKLRAAAHEHAAGALADVRDALAKQAESGQRDCPELHPLHQSLEGNGQGTPSRRSGSDRRGFQNGHEIRPRERDTHDRCDEAG